MKNSFPLLFTLLLLCCSPAFAQSEGALSGTVVDGKEQPVGFVNVAVLEAATSKVVTGAIADMEGRFQIKTPGAGNYLLKISALGYVETQTGSFKVTGSGFSKDFGKLQVKEDVKTLSEVQVQTMRPTVTAHPDKMVVSVEGTALASGSTAYEVLAKSPGVWIDQDGNLQLNGKAGVQVMLNGKRSFLSGKELQNLLQGMSAENIKDLELITNPSSKYDAEGASGIININLKQPQRAGMNGSVYGGYQYNNLSSYTGGGELSHKSGKWSSFGSVDFARRMRYRDAKMDRVFMSLDGSKSTFDQIGYEEGDRLQPSLRIGADYDLNKQHSIGVMANLNLNQSENLFRTDSYLRNANVADNLFIHSLNSTKGTYGNGTVNFHYLGRLDSLGTILSADLDYVHINSQDDASFQNNYMPLSNPSAQWQELLLSENPTSYNIYSVKVDFTKPIGKKTKLELGAKASHVTSDNELLFFQTSDGREIPDPTRSNHFIYKEEIYAGYANVSATLGNKWTVQGGLRAEQTESSGNSLTKNQKTDRSYLDLFPSLFVQQKINENYQIGYKYSRRINRPNYQSLNPFIFFLDPFTSAQGNPYLKPQYVNSFEVTQTLKQTYNLVLGYAVTNDFIAEVPNQNPEDNTTVFQQQNVKNLKSATATLVAPVRVSKKWEISNNLITMYQEFTNMSGDEVVVNDQVTVIAQTNHNIMLPYGLRLELNGGYQSPAVYGLYRIEDQMWLDAGLKRDFLNDKLTMTLNVTDIFKGRVMNVEANLHGNTNAIEQYHGARGIRLNLRYRFNKGTAFQSKKRNVNLDELNRAGGN